MTTHSHATPPTPAWLILVSRILEILFGVGGLIFLMVMAIRRETIPVPIGTALPVPWVTLGVGVVSVLPWTMGRAFARNFITGALGRFVPRAGGES
jgi:hypothetical protein